jgi:hypothetical protein
MRQWANPGLTPLEVAASVVFGVDQDAAAPEASGDPTPREALERALARALRRSPCLISFSGGRDSSALLALAVHVAEREGLAQPVPITARFPGLAGPQETEWQEQVIAHLRLDNWIVRTFDAEVDLVGPVARDLMSRRGVPYPYNLHLQAPLVAEASGGAFVTGLGGDEAFVPAPRPLAVLAGFVRPTARDVLRIGLALAPRAVRRRRLAQTQSLTFAWLRPDANAALTSAWVEEAARLPVRWSAGLIDWWRSRYLQLTVATIAQLGVDLGADMHHPFADAGVVAALAAAGGTSGFRSRTAALAALFGDLLPPALPQRETKATFNDVLWNEHSRRFAAEIRDDLDALLRGAELEAIIDPEALRAHWAGPSPAANSFLLLQACWVARHVPGD